MVKGWYTQQTIIKLVDNMWEILDKLISNLNYSQSLPSQSLVCSVHLVKCNVSQPLPILHIARRWTFHICDTTTTTMTTTTTTMTILMMMMNNWISIVNNQGEMNQFFLRICQWAPMQFSGSYSLP